MPAKVFDGVDAVQREFEAGEFVRVEGRANRPHQKLELVIEKIRRVDEAADRQDGFREEDCIPSRAAAGRGDVAGAQVARRACAQPVDPAAADAILDRHGERLRIWPAALTVHHAYRGGLLEHVLKLAETGEALAAAYGADADLLLAGAILHDLGKLDELSYDGVTSYSLDGNLLGHITIGVMMVREAASAIDGFPADLRLRIEHMILSHHGEREQGSPVEPMTAEAFILSALDDLDATLHQVQAARRRTTGARVILRRITPAWAACCSNPPAADQPHEEEHDGDDQQDVDEIPERVAADHSEQPEHDQNDRNRFEHGTSP